MKTMPSPDVPCFEAGHAVVELNHTEAYAEAARYGLTHLATDRIEPADHQQGWCTYGTAAALWGLGDYALGDQLARLNEFEQPGEKVAERLFHRLRSGDAADGEVENFISSVKPEDGGTVHAEAIVLNAWNWALHGEPRRAHQEVWRLATHGPLDEVSLHARWSRIPLTWTRRHATISLITATLSEDRSVAHNTAKHTLHHPSPAVAAAAKKILRATTVDFRTWYRYMSEPLYINEFSLTHGVPANNRARRVAVDLLFSYLRQPTAEGFGVDDMSPRELTQRYIELAQAEPMSPKALPSS